MDPYKLNEDLKLGVATAATQIEGGDTNNSWYEWAQEKDHIIDGTTPLRANEHYKRYKEDIDLMKDLSIECYRFSIEWSRIEPEEGKFNLEAINHYIDEIKSLKEKNIEVLVTLHHFSNPLWFEEMGAFKSKKSIFFFTRYAMYVVQALKDYANEFITINEPNVYATNGYFFGIWPSGEKSFFSAVKVMKNLAKCHISSYNAIHKIIPNARVGFANHLAIFSPLREKSLYDKITCFLVAKFFQGALTDAMALGKFRFPFCFLSSKRGVYYDFIGINYYTRRAISGFNTTFFKNTAKNDLGWEIYPEGLGIIADEQYKKYKKEIYITENGTCDKEDAFRSKYIYDHLKEVSKRDFIKKYFYWTFMDNFEWAEGESAPFGIVKCDFPTQKRKIRKSGYFYKEIIDKKEVNCQMIDEFLK